MIHEEICTYEVAKLAKKKGFPVKEIEHWYCEYDGRPTKEIIDEQQHPIINQSLLQRWLREEKGVIVEVIAQPTCSTSKKNCYWWSIKQNSDGFCYQYEECSYLLYSDEGYFDTYELALEDALAYSLENLV